MLVVYGGLIGLTYFQFSRTPSGFIPPLDRAYFITAVTLPPGSSLERTDAVIRKANDILLSRPGVAHTVTFAGFDGATFTNAPNSGVLFVTLKPFEERVKAKLSTAIDPQRPARPDAAVARGVRAGDPAAVGARHRHRRRLQALCAGSRRPRPARA